MPMAPVSPLRVITAPGLAAVPGLVHGFEQKLTAGGGETSDASRRRVAAALASQGRLLLLSQVHGAGVREAPWEGRPTGDAAVAEAPGLLLGIETADCLPVLLVDERRRAVAAAHAGWRGTVAGVARAAVDALVAGGSRPEHLRAALGPGIRSCCYEVGGDVRAAFGPAGDAFFRPGPAGRDHLDVLAANMAQLLEAGLHPDQIEVVDGCTFCRPDDYHSYRRDGPGQGRAISFVGFEKAPASAALEAPGEAAP